MDTTNWNSGAGFLPIGTSYASRFVDTFNGNGKAIRNLFINRPGSGQVGLFGWVEDGTILNLRLEGGSVTGGELTGALIGYLAYGSVSNCHSSATVSGSRVGGLVGGCSGGTLTHCSVAGAVMGGDSVGGLLGENGSGWVIASFATGPISGGEHVGGLVGFNNGPVSSCFVTGAVAGSSSVGGLVGTIADAGTISGCYAAGPVTGNVSVGGFVGFSYGGTATNSYWDMTASGKNDSAGGSGCVGLPTAQMMQQASYEGWDFTNVWTISEGVGYPELIMPTMTRIIGLSGYLAFGDVVTGSTATATLSITNSGSVLLTVTNITYPAGFSGAWSGTIEAGRATNVTVTFRPTAVQSYGGTVAVNSDKTAGENTIGVTGAGEAPPKPGQLCFSASTYVAQEGLKRKILVKRTNGSSGTVSVQCVMKPKSALALQDYTPASYTLTWTNGQTASKAIKITIIADGKAEGNEAFQVLLKNPVGATLTTPFKATITILGNSKGE